MGGWVGQVIGIINVVVLVVSLGLEAWAFVHALLQKAEAFPAVETLQKGVWLALIGGTMLASLLFYAFGMLFAMIALIAALVYLLDVRPRIREISGGGSRW
ncbi:DUF2516 family protein [Cryptosporangium minutisporangium]|uniref:DUF2516 family protein n=1 Tax=Cryptosporangium minutisporangium TaxID=113569 RepID=A0ABP6T9J0_9ACTN